jgi:hypothetical protein
LYTPIPDGPPPFSLVHPSINLGATSKLVCHIYSVQSIIVIAIYFVSKDSTALISPHPFIQNQFNFLNPLQLSARHRKNVQWLCVIQAKGNKVWVILHHPLKLLTF